MGHRRGVALGSDMDGGFGPDGLPEGIDRPERLETLLDALRAAGWSDADIEGFARGNWRRLLEEVLAEPPESTSARFVSEPITPERGLFSTELMARGLASLPDAFTWRGRRYVVVECLEHVKQTSPEGGSGERYLRRQAFTVRLDTGQQATIYVERQSRRGASGRAARQRWFLYTIDDPEP